MNKSVSFLTCLGVSATLSWSFPAEARRIKPPRSTTTTTTTTSTTTTLAPTTTTTMAPTTTTTTQPPISGSPFTKPVLLNPVNPISYGAKCDGVTDDSAAFQAAVRASDVLVPAANCVINKPIYVTTSNRHIECSAGGTLMRTNPYAGSMFVFTPGATPSITGNSLVNCHLVGMNTVAPQYYDNDNRHWDLPVKSDGGVNNILIAGNSFERFFGQAMVELYSPDPNNHGSGGQIIYNTFRSCGYYGPVLVGQTNTVIGHNTVTDCVVGIENDNLTQASGGNIIESNTIYAIYGTGFMAGVVALQGGLDPWCVGMNYTTNTVRNNVVSGISSGGFSGQTRNSAIYERPCDNSPGGIFYGNQCINGCVDFK